MKHSFIAISACALLSTMAATTCYANNENVENALKNQPDLSSFYQVLVATGVNNELHADSDYTIFAPTNDAMAKLNQSKYSCFNTPKCQAQTAAVVRNHIVVGKIDMDDAAKRKGGLYTLGARFVTIGASRMDYTVDKGDVLSASEFDSGMLYSIDNVIANPRELASIQYPQYANIPERITTTSETTIADPSCGAAGCPDALTQTTTIIHPTAMNISH